MKKIDKDYRIYRSRITVSDCGKKNTIHDTEIVENAPARRVLSAIKAAESHGVKVTSDTLEHLLDADAVIVGDMFVVYVEQSTYEFRKEFGSGASPNYVKSIDSLDAAGINVIMTTGHVTFY